MVSSLVVDAVANPTQALQDLYYEAKDNDTDAFSDRVSSHFSEIFALPHAMAEIPVLDLQNPPEKYRNGALVQFSAMIQDTSISPDVYLAKLRGGKLGGWGLVDETPGQVIDYTDLRECSVFWAVSIPGELKDEQSEDAHVHVITQSHKYPIPGAKHIGAKIKVYDAHAESYRATDVVNFVGILSSEPNHADLDGSTSTLVPTLHVLFSRPKSSTATLKPVDPTLRSELISWIAKEGLAGDELAAEWLLISSLAKVQSRTPPILPHTFCISRFPAPPLGSSPTPSLSQVLSLLFPYATTIPLSLSTINTTAFSPESHDEDLHSGWLQLPKGTRCVVTETGVQEGTVTERGLMNLRRMQDVMSTQMLEYVFPFSKFTFETDVVFVVLCEGSKSAFFQNNVIFPLSSSADPSEVYKMVARPDKLEQFREFVLSARASTTSVSDETAKYIQEDFVRERQDSKGKITADDFIHRMTVARLLALSYGEAEISKETWERTKTLDAERMTRIV